VTAQTFENRPADTDRRAALERAISALHARDERVPTITAVSSPRPEPVGPSDAIPLPEPLAPLIPTGLVRGEAIEIDSPGGAPDYLALAVLAGALRQGLWCAAIGLPGLGGLALAEMLTGDDVLPGALQRLLYVPKPGERWAEVTAVLAEGLDMLLLRPATPVTAATARQVTARLRESGTRERHSAALAVIGRWPSARLTLRTEASVWTGLTAEGPAAGTGHLQARRARIAAEGRATAGRRRTVEVWLPAVGQPWKSVEPAVSQPERQLRAA